MYADDTSLDKAFRTSQELKEEMISAFSKVCKWLRNNKLSLNTVKTLGLTYRIIPSAAVSMDTFRLYRK